MPTEARIARGACGEHSLPVPDRDRLHGETAGPDERQDRGAAHAPSLSIICWVVNKMPSRCAGIAWRRLSRPRRRGRGYFHAAIGHHMEEPRRAGGIDKSRMTVFSIVQ